MRHTNETSARIWSAPYAWLLTLTLALSLSLAAPALSQQPAPAATPSATTTAPPAATPPATPPAAAVATPPAATPAPAPTPAPVVLSPDILDPVTRLSKSVETAEKSIQQLKELEGELSRVRTDVERIIYDSTATAEQLRPQLEEVKRQIEKLGPTPSKDLPAENATILAERTRLNQQAAALDGAIKTTELAWVRAKQLIDRITVIRYQLFTRNLLEKRDSPVLPAVWRDVTGRWDSIKGRMQYYGGDWMTWARRQSGMLSLLLLGVVALFSLISIPAHRLMQRSLVRPAHSPNFFERVMKGVWMAPLLAIAPIAAATALYTGLDALDLLFVPWSAPANAALQGVFVFAVASGLLTVALQPKHPAWRLFPVSDRTAARVLWILRAFVAVYVLDTILLEFGRLLYVNLSVTVVQSFLTSLLFVGLLVALLLTPFEPQVGPDRPVNGHVYVAGPVSRYTPVWIKAPLWLIALTILVSSLLGYIALGRFISHQLVLSGMVLAATGVAYLAIRAATRGRHDGSDILGNALATKLGLDVPRRRQLTRLAEFTGTLLLLLTALPLLLLQWGFSSADIRDWFKAAIFGFEIGQFRISLARILLGLLLFMALIFTTRLIQKWLRDSVLAAPRVDPGIANSVDTAVGYGGIGLAALISVSYAGFDITSLAIVAGALSVGIGFGLQSIVNNFVSGLILLVERPIKVGDWIVVGGDQGNVRRISVRSTEIETFDRASLIVPNSELISGRVLNWTHRNHLGRIIIKLPLPPVESAEQVLKILVDAALAHPDVVKTPPPAAGLDAFTTSQYDFSLRATLDDVTQGGKVQSDLRLDILKRLRDAGIFVVPPPPPAVL
ncbi:MAG: mechanosensitive ion channel family protein [Hyphomicrobiaceae bacterium]|nr:mechanosensitive ion channel family protein [Hyphomicrobiaceae bacterium]